MKKTVYLDQNAWITLLREKEGKTRNSEIRKSLETVVEASENDKAILPISIVHLTETAVRRNDESRDKLFDFMFGISKGYAIIPYSRIVDREIWEAVKKTAGLPTVDLEQVVIGKGISFVFGAKANIVTRDKGSQDMPEDLKRRILEKVESLDTLRHLMKNKELIQKMGRKDVEILGELEKSRKQDEGIKGKDLRRRVNIARVFRDIITPELTRVRIALGLEPRLPADITREEIEELFRDIPTLYTSWELTFRRDVQFQRKIHKNDLYDIAALSIAIPYCDIVVAEKMFTRIARQARLDTLYHTVILSSVEELHQFLG
jgi:hypothetical protein